MPTGLFCPSPRSGSYSTVFGFPDLSWESMRLPHPDSPFPRGKCTWSIFSSFCIQWVIQSLSPRTPQWKNGPFLPEWSLRNLEQQENLKKDFAVLLDSDLLHPHPWRYTSREDCCKISKTSYLGFHSFANAVLIQPHMITSLG